MVNAIFFATLSECRKILEKIEMRRDFTIKGVKLVRGLLCGCDTVLCVTGIGKINATISAMVVFQSFPIKGALISGIAGAYPSSRLKIGEIVVATKEIEVDQGLLIEFDKFISIEPVEVELFVPTHLEGLRRGIFLTVSACTGNLRRALFLERTFQGICENMEGAAIAKVCSLHGVNAIQIRSISNYVEDRDRLLSLNQVKSASEVVQNFILENYLEIFESP